MKFRTIVLTKRRLAAGAMCILAAVIIPSVIAYLKSQESVEVFDEDKQIYEEMLNEGLPDNSDEDTSLLDIVKQIIGFDVDEPETIISQASPIFSENTNDTPPQAGEDIAAEEEAPTSAPTAEPQTQTSKPEFPSKEEICQSIGIEVNNSSNYAIDANRMCGEELPFKIDDSGPQVLVVHTHTTECYAGDEMSGDTERSTDESRNMIEVGNVVCDVLEECGISCVHDTTVHDYPSYQGAYTRALSTITANLNKYPSIKVVLDIHRDAFIYPDGSKLRVACEQNGVQTAKVMIVAGTDSMGLSNPNWRENFKLAAKIQNAAQIMYPGLMRPINLRRERFNMHMTTGSLLLEIGSNGNVLEEAKEGAKDTAYAIAAVLTQ